MIKCGTYIVEMDVALKLRHHRVEADLLYVLRVLCMFLFTTQMHKQYNAINNYPLTM